MEKGIESPTIFVHGKESSSRGTKGIFFKDLLPEMIIPDFAGDIPKRMSKLNRILQDKTGITMIGSSLGGLMAGICAFQNQDSIKKLILLAPALNHAAFKGYLSKRLAVPVFVFHGKDDELIPPEPIQDIATKVFLNLTLTLVDDDHRLSKTFASMDWPGLICR